MTSYTNNSLSGVILLDKPVGISSNKALSTIKKKFYLKKAGHTGTLDPLASGLLPICINKATKLCSYLLNAKKRYLVKAQLGIKTSTGDKEGDIISKKNTDYITSDDIKKIATSFIGASKQTPPMHSAIKVNGMPLYKLARQGKTIKRAARSITIYELIFLNYKNNTCQFDILCSKGTYIRQLIEDIGEKLGCGAFTTELRRSEVDIF